MPHSKAHVASNDDFKKVLSSVNVELTPFQEQMMYVKPRQSGKSFVSQIKAIMKCLEDGELAVDHDFMIGNEFETGSYTQKSSTFRHWKSQLKKLIHDKFFDYVEIVSDNTTEITLKRKLRFVEDFPEVCL